MQHPLVPVSSLFTITVSVSLIHLMGLIPHQPILIVTKLTTSLNHVIGKFYLSLHLLDTIRPGIHQVFGQLQVKLINDGNFAGVGVDWLLLCLTLILLLRLQSSQIVKVCPLFHAISDPN